MTIPLEQKVTSLELSKKLKKLGLRQDSHFYWSEKEVDMGCKFRYIMICTKDQIILKSSNTYYSAYTADELRQIFSKLINNEDNEKPNSMAERLIFLIENKLTEVPK